MAHAPTVSTIPWPGAFYDLAYDTREQAFAAADAIRDSCRFGYNHDAAQAAIDKAIQEIKDRDGNHQS